MLDWDFAISSEDSEGDVSDLVPNSQSVLQAVSFQDQNISQNDHPQPSLWQMPEAVDLDKIGLQCSSRLAELNKHETIATHATTSEPIISHSQLLGETIGPHSAKLCKTIGPHSSSPTTRGFKLACLALWHAWHSSVHFVLMK